MATKTYDFGDALYFMRQGRAVTRTAWDEERELEINRVGQLIVHSEEPDMQWEADNESLLAEDWYDL